TGVLQGCSTALRNAGTSPRQGSSQLAFFRAGLPPSGTPVAPGRPDVPFARWFRRCRSACGREHLGVPQSTANGTGGPGACLLGADGRHITEGSGSRSPRSGPPPGEGVLGRQGPRD